MKIEKCIGYTSDGEDFHTTLEAAQTAAIAGVYNEFGKGPIALTSAAIAEFTVSHLPEILEILATKPRGRPRNTKGNTKMRKAKLATAPLPLAEKEGA